MFTATVHPSLLVMGIGLPPTTTTESKVCCLLLAWIVHCSAAPSLLVCGRNALIPSHPDSLAYPPSSTDLYLPSNLRRAQSSLPSEMIRDCCVQERSLRLSENSAGQNKSNCQIAAKVGHFQHCLHSLPISISSNSLNSNPQFPA